MRNRREVPVNHMGLGGIDLISRAILAVEFVGSEIWDLGSGIWDLVVRPW